MKKYILLLLLLLCIGGVSGCSSDSAYQNFKEYSDKSYERLWTNNHETDDMNIREKAYYYGLKLLNAAKPICFIGSVISIIVGIILLNAVKKTRSVRKFAITVLIIGIPLLSILIIIGLAGLLALLK